MTDETKNQPRPTPNPSAHGGSKPQDEGLTPEKMQEILARARQTVKPIINHEAANEIVSDEILNFRMKSGS